MPPHRTMDRTRPRQDPVSCQLCRLKKLKCDRQRPCHNCFSRKLTCEYRGEQPPVVPDYPRDHELVAENRAIKARLEKLEQAVFGVQAQAPYPVPSDQSLSRAGSNSSQTRTEGGRPDEDSEWLEAVSTHPNVLLPEFRFPFLVDVQDMRHTFTSSQNNVSNRVIRMPAYTEALECLDSYATNLDVTQHIMHIDTARSSIDRIYSHIESQQSIDPGVLAFVLGICASINFYWATGVHKLDGSFGEHQTAAKVSTEWAKQSLLALEQVRLESASASLEAIQASIMLVFIFFHIEGMSSRVRMMHTTAVTLARDLGLHLVDVPGSQKLDYTQEEVIGREIKRKIWWHLCSTDWFFAFVEGPREGSYSINPRHMYVNMPRNLDRHDLNTQGPNFSRDLTEPTIMSYSLQRIKLATTCREIQDALWCYPQPEQIKYDVITALDTKFDDQLAELPRFLQFGIPSDQLRAEYGDVFDQKIKMQAVMTHIMLHTRRCKLHLPFLIRAKTNSRFVFSRRMGLRSARAVFAACHFEAEDGSIVASHLKLGGLLQQYFYATVVLVMDICVNNDNDPVQIDEIRSALRVMEETKQCLSLRTKYCDSLMAILQKHKIKLLPTTENEALPDAVAGSGLFHEQQTVQHKNTVSHDTIDIDNYPGSNGGLSFDDGLWQDYLVNGPMLNPQDWDELLHDLDMQTM